MKRTLSALMLCVALISPFSLWAQCPVPNVNNPNAITCQGPGPFGGYPIPVTTNTGCPIDVTSSGGLSACVTQCTSPWLTGYQNSVLSSANSSSTPLLAGQTFTGTFENVTGYSGVLVQCITPQQSAVDGVVVEYSTDGVTFGSSNQTVFWSNNSAMYVPILGPFARVKYTNGAANQTSFVLQTRFLYQQPTPEYQVLSQSYSKDGIPSDSIALLAESALVGLDSANLKSYQITTPNDITAEPYDLGANIALDTNSYQWASSGGSGGRNEVKVRTPSTFKVVATAATGNTALWTPAAGKKFRLMRWRYTVTESATTAGGADIVIKLFDGAAGATGQQDTVTVPAAALATAGQLASSPWIDLGNGYLSTAANNVLNVNLSAALATGTVTVEAVGTEE